MENFRENKEPISKRKLIYISLEGPRQRPFLSYYIEWLKLGKGLKSEDKREVLVNVLLELQSNNISSKTKSRFKHDGIDVPALLIDQISVAALPPTEPEQFIVLVEGDARSLIEWLEKNKYKVECRDAQY